jgi:rhodanese-related sulfurtransferase
VNPSNVPTVSVAEIPDGALIIDVREPHEWDAGHIDAAQHIPMGTIPASVGGELNTAERLYIVCAVGGRSAQVAAWLVNQGYDAVNVAGGMHAWAHAARPMVSSNGAAPTVI